MPDDLTVLAKLEQLSIKFNKLKGAVIPATWTNFENLLIM